MPTAPGSPPSNVMAIALSSNQILVTWDMVLPVAISVMKFVAVTLLVYLLGSSLLHDAAEARPSADLSPEMGEVVGAGQEAAGSLGNAAAEEKEARCTPPDCR